MAGYSSGSRGGGGRRGVIQCGICYGSVAVEGGLEG